MTLYSFFTLGRGGFQKKWNQAVADYSQDDSPQLVRGPWIGSWHTETNGHKGSLQCLANPSDDPDHFEFRFHASWGPFFKCGYHVEFEVQEVGNRHEVEGSDDLGMFGIYEFRGTISADTFHAQYSSSKGDKGYFEMQRPVKVL